MAKAANSSATPVMRQYLTAKDAHKDALLFFRMGDFYELFYEDAVVAARALELTLTARNKGAADEVPMAGVPHHAVSGYIQRLLEQGFKVAICEQMADPSKVKGIVPREVVRVVTPGIVFDDSSLVARQNHYVVATEKDSSGFGIGALDLSTGELTACFAPDLSAALGEVVRLDPRELLVGPGVEDLQSAVATSRLRAVVRAESSPLDETSATAILDALLGDGEARRACASTVARSAAARCIELARQCEAGRPLPITRLSAYELGETLVLDEATQNHLELARSTDGDSKGALLSHIDLTTTAAGARLLRRRLLAPSTDLVEISRRLDLVEAFVQQSGMRRSVREHLGNISDLERLAVKFAFARALPRDFVALRTSLVELPKLKVTLEECKDPMVRELCAIDAKANWFDTCSELADLLACAISDDPPAKPSDGGVVRTGFDSALDEGRTLTRDGQRLIVELEARLREAAQIPSLKLRFTRVFGWYIEVTRTHLEKAPSTWRRKQTIATGERFSCDELDSLADKLVHAEERSASREAELYTVLVKKVATYADRLRAIAARLSEWDVASALAELAHRDDYARPIVDDSLALDIRDGRHPVVEKMAAAGRFVPNDAVLDASPANSANGKRLWLVTGPNMAGKSTLMRQVAIITILAQMGSYVPAKSARIGMVDRVLTRVGASDNLSRGDSTFMVEMKETANVLRRATKHSLVVLDEIGRGTSTFDGLAIAWAVAEYLHDAIGCRAMFATHYHELTELCVTRTGCDNVSVSAREHDGEIVFLHRLQHGAASQSYGVACARLAGIPEPVLARARAILGELERTGTIHGRAPNRNEMSDQLNLFAGASKKEDTSATAAIEMLRAVDVNRLTPLEALQFVATLQKTLQIPREG